ncbi:hypothetical protein SAMN05444166_8352 [Singulisphaera sp. GP187]|uniref:hypothetical protein n=1 Tax=Singulisphaera sp. GP187 TaxID=1882752 RepID=UPI00092C74FC|nr:hypothetical protein [Singulisphaera sp. GP187]SIO67388.1 hypothetical protein SAMN05444166_8352 [Singulisphaera sp. GP187]
MEKFIRNLNPPRWVSPIVARVHPARPWLLGVVYWLALVPLAFSPKISGNVSSRYMTIEGIVERGTLSVESSPLRAASGTPDLVRFGRHLYSDKPPVLSAIGAAVYAVVYQSGVRFSGSMSEFVVANWVLVVSIVGVASALTLVWLRQLLQTIPIAPWVADGLTLGFGFGSLLLAYGVTFNNHSVAAGLVTGALALTLLEDPEHKRVPLRRALAGLLAGLTATVDLPMGGVLLVALSVWLTLRSRTMPWSFLAGACLPLLFHCVLQPLVTGTPLPVEMYPDAFDYPGSYWATAGVWKETGPRWRFALELLFGPQGWITVTPVLAFAAIGLGSALARRDDPLRPLALAVGGMVGVLVVYYVWGVRRTDYAGQSFGTRHLLAITPACYFFAVAGVSRLKSKLAWAGFVILLVVGSLYGVAGLRDPWSRIERRVATDPALRLLQNGVIYPWSSYQR